MKNVKYFFLSGLTILIISASCQKQQLEPVNHQKPSEKGILSWIISIEVDVKFGHNEFVGVDSDGKAIIAPCVGYGICDIHVETSTNDDSDGYGELGLLNGGLKLLVEKEGLDSGSQGLFTNGSFIVPEPLVLSDDICDALGLSRGYTIEQGAYTYSETTDYYLISL